MREKWQRSFYTPVKLMGENGQRITGSKEHTELSRKAAAEGMVLLKNEREALPLAAGTKVALFGKGTIDYVKGGGGSGDVTVEYIHSLYDGMKAKEVEGKTAVFDKLADFYRKEIEEQYANGAVPGMTVEPKIPEELLKEARAFADTAIISICRFSGEGWDRTAAENPEGYVPEGDEKTNTELSAKIFERSDFYLTNAETAMVESVKNAFPKVIVVLNVGGVIDTSWFKECENIQSVLLAWQGGMEGGLAAADILCGDVTPSGKLSDTFAGELNDYPSTAGFHESVYYADYTEDIYVGYRYFETIPGVKEKVSYPFGYGLSYTSFEWKAVEASVNKTVKNESKSEIDHANKGITEDGAADTKKDAANHVENDTDKDTANTDLITIKVEVKNVGKLPGKEVLQLYYSAPQGKLGKPAKVLGAFVKTELLEAEHAQTLTLTLPAAQMASYDDLGKIAKSAWVLETGTYEFYLGTNVRDAQKLDFVYDVKENTVVEQLSSKAAPKKLAKRMLADGSFEELPVGEYLEECALTRIDIPEIGLPAPHGRAGYDHSFLDEVGILPRKVDFLDVAEGKMSMEEFLSYLTLDDLISLVGGQPNTGCADTYGMGNIPEYGVPNVMTADGPAGLRIRAGRGVTTTAWPCATLLACTWDEALVEQVGKAAAKEVKENNISIWLTPACNIHRSPLCGRNFEYYSEDPYLSGKIGAAMVRGIQSEHIAASVKHFAANNKETNRKDSDSRVSERALREIYLKQFEIIVKEADPWTIMSSYNFLNGIHASENKDLLTGILREEWGYDGLVTTDWWNFAEHYLEIKAGNDIKMGAGYPERVRDAYEKGLVSEDEIRQCARRVLELILKLD